MAKSLTNEQDVKVSLESGESSFKRPLKIPANETPWRFLNLAYEDGYVHYIRTAQSVLRAVCLGGPEGNGFAPADCPICQLQLDHYNEAKEIRADEGEESIRAQKVKDLGNDMRAKYEAHFLAVRGARIVERNSQGKLVKTSIFEQVEGAENEDIEAGILSLTKAQYRNLVALIDADTVPQITCGEDLQNFTLWTTKVSKKGNRGDGKYQEVQWGASSKPTDCPFSEDEIEALREEFDISEGFAPDPDHTAKVVKLLGGKLTGGADDDVELDDQIVETEEEVSEADLADEDTVEEDESPAAKPRKAAPVLADVEEGEEFEDDLPYDLDEDEEEAPPKKADPVKKAAPVSKGKRRV